MEGNENNFSLKISAKYNILNKLLYKFISCKINNDSLTKNKFSIQFRCKCMITNLL